MDKLKSYGLICLFSIYLICLAFFLLRIDFRFVRDYFHIESAPSHATIYRGFTAISANEPMKSININPTPICNMFLFFPTNQTHSILYWNQVLSNHKLPINIRRCTSSIISSSYLNINNQHPLYNLYIRSSYNAALTFSNLFRNNQILVQNGKWTHQIYLPISSNAQTMSQMILSQKP